MKFLRLFFVSILLLTLSCSKDDNTPSEIEVQKFTWKGLNAYYLWQDKIKNLSDREFSSDQQLHSFLSQQGSPEEFFNSLLYQKGTVDKWSWIVDDYVALEEAFQGTTLSNGMKFGLVKYRSFLNNVYGYVRYVVPNSEAENKGVTRGMIFSEINGTQITKSNYKDLLFSDDTNYTINLADHNSGNPVTNGNSITLEKGKYTENPVHISKTLDINGKKIGYLLYNGFTSNFDSQLNQAFGQFKADGVTDLVLDLRYNPGGAVSTAIYLASMITGQFNGEVFAKQRWNQKYMNSTNSERLINRFVDKLGNSETINSLNLSDVYIITTNSSASASELVINGLDAYINVITIGTTTNGKYAGSVTLYDSEDYSKNNVNPNHTWAMQPIVLEIVNKDDENQKEGITPDANNEIEESLGSLTPLGDPSEPLLARAIQLITGTSGKLTNINQIDNLSPIHIGDSEMNTPNYNRMYVDF